MSRGDYPIQEFLRSLIDQYGPTPTEFVRTLGYSKHSNEHCTRLGLWLSEGQGDDKIISQIYGNIPDMPPDFTMRLTPQRN